MSGRPTYTDRREFLKRMMAFAAVPFAAGAASCRAADPYAHITGSIVGANHQTGHLLRSGNLPAPSSYIDTGIAIVGGGISGLSARRFLHINGVTDVLMLEMDNRVGGNSVSDSNKVSSYPWGAHYLPIPDVENKELLDFLHTAGTITAFDGNGLPVYNEYHICHDPEERLYINGTWQEGIVPKFGIGADDERQIARFFQTTEALKTAKGSDGLFAFRIPLDASSADETYRKLDKVSFAQYLSEQGYTSPYLLWYLEYCCKDDYGANLAQTSAWAGLHYFAARKGRAANAPSSAVLTWPQGNAYLMNQLRQQGPNNIRTGMLAHKVVSTDDGVMVHCYDTKTRQTIGIRAKKVLLAGPQYVNKHLLGNIGGRDSLYPMLNYSPWMVANITVSHLPQHRGFALCWDNVIYGRKSVGYVFANHQNLTAGSQGVITWYLPIIADSASAARNTIYNRTYTDWVKEIIDELSYAHEGIADHISNIDIWLWGHGMIRPAPGYVWSPERQQARQPVDGKIFFAHTDLSGISIFEEGFYQGITAAKQMMQAT